VPLGGLRVTSYGSHSPSDVAQSGITDCRLLIEKRLPFSVLDGVRPVAAAPLPDLAWLDHLSDDPIGALRGFVAGWFADVPVATSVPSAGPVPAALAALYEAAAGRREPLGMFNQILTPNQFWPVGDGRVVFGSECQGVWNVLMDPTESDPTVTYDDLGNGPVTERERLAGFLVQFSLFDASIGSPYGGFATVDRHATADLIAALRPVPLQPLHIPADPTRLYVGRGVAVATTDLGPDAVEVYAGSRQRAALRILREPGFDWEQFTG
jgi:hypothetical protein